MSKPPEGPVRVVVDTNVILPILTGNMPERNWLRELWTAGQIVPLVNEETLAELREKLLERSPSTKEYQADLFVRKALAPYLRWCEVVPVRETQSPVCRDTEDQKFIDLGLNGEADYLVTRDRALLEMSEILPFRVLDDPDFRAVVVRRDRAADPGDG